MTICFMFYVYLFYDYLCSYKFSPVVTIFCLLFCRLSYYPIINHLQTNGRSDEEVDDCWWLEYYIIHHTKNKINQKNLSVKVPVISFTLFTVISRSISECINIILSNSTGIYNFNHQTFLQFKTKKDIFS